MIKDLKIAVAQINPIVGDLKQNRLMIEKIWSDFDHEADLVVFPEMSFTGYPLEDLVLRTSFLEDVQNEIQNLAEENRTKSASILIGAPIQEGKNIYNAMILLGQGQARTVLKHDLANENIYDEPRVFSKGPLPEPLNFKGVKLGIMICQDVWSPKVSAYLKQNGAECLIVPNGSVYETGKQLVRINICKNRVKETDLPLLYMNLVGGQDEVVFDGRSFWLDEDGNLKGEMKSFEPEMCLLDQINDTPQIPENQLIYKAAVMGLRDYVLKSGFKNILLGLSGGVDSALTAVMAVDALGAENVHCVLLPSPFTSEESNEDALQLIQNLSVSYRVISIEPAMKSFSNMVKDLEGLAHENMQSRARGVTLMTLSNQTGALLLSTGNKSEIAVGYSTLYGDMCGAYNPLKDIYKTKVFELCRLRNEWKPAFAKGEEGYIIPERIITKAPTAELRKNQKDEDSLPPYEVLDQILEGFIEQEKSKDDLVQKGFQKDIVEKVYKLLHRAEYKRRQSCPGPNITSKSFGGRARRYPIVNKY